MTHSYKIIKINTQIHNGIQWVSFYLDGFTSKLGDQYLSYSFSDISDIYSLSVDELEIITGSNLELTFYESSEYLGFPIFDHRVRDDGSVIKSEVLRLGDDLDKVRKEKKFIGFTFWLHRRSK